MAQVDYQAVVQLVDQLSAEQKQALIAHLQKSAKERELNFEEWKALFDSLKISSPVGKDFSLNREDWYGDDGR